ncbi:MAG TPA: HAD-IC family P-type ATPase [Bryobacteraceae bacterium]|nr:HAD-IC family P-type ATPase [Bryobacteraceae bacterium]
MPDLRLTDSNPESTSVGEPRGPSQADSRHHPHNHEHRQEDEDHDDHQDHDEGWLEWARVGFVAVILALVWAQVVPRVKGIDILAVIGVLIGGYPIFKEAIADLLDRRMTMELSMTIALVAASVIGEFFTALLITVFVLIAEILEGMTVGRGRRAIRELLDLLPQTAEVRRAGQVAARNLSEVEIGDVVLVRPGGRIPVDGVVASGHSFVDQSTITGESMPVEKISGTPVFAGTINQSGVLEIRARRSAATPLLDASSRQWSARSGPARPSSARRTAWLATWFTSRWPAQP